jgi:cholesterol transport system auxiliary component
MTGSLDKSRPWWARVFSPLGAGALVAVILGGCSVGLLPGGGEKPALYMLSPKSTFHAELPAIDAQLVIETPIASEGLDTHRIALRESPLTIDYFAGARWTERAPKLVQTLLVESFENTDRIISVARQGTDLRADYVLKTELREFQAEYIAGGPVHVVRVRLNGKLIKLPRRVIIASTTIEKNVPAEGTDIESIVIAFDEALGKVMRPLVEWTLLTIVQTVE